MFPFYGSALLIFVKRVTTNSISQAKPTCGHNAADGNRLHCQRIVTCRNRNACGVSLASGRRFRFPLELFSTILGAQSYACFLRPRSPETTRDAFSRCRRDVDIGKKACFLPGAIFEGRHPRPPMRPVGGANQTEGANEERRGEPLGRTWSLAERQPPEKTAPLDKFEHKTLVLCATDFVRHPFSGTL